MRAINELLRNLQIKPIQYQKIGNATIVTTKDRKYVIKKNKHPIYDYLNQRTFSYYPKTRVVGDYEIAEYIEEIAPTPPEQKMTDLIMLVALLHTKTTHYKLVEEYSYQDLYESIKGNIAYLEQFYNQKMDMVESEIFMSPSSYLLARHITSIYNMLKYSREHLDKWYEKVKDFKKIRLVILHNHLSLDHFLNNQLISWNKAKIGPPIFDLYILYQNTYLSFAWEEIFKQYLSSYPLKEEEKDLFYILISIPKPLEFTQREYQNVAMVQGQLRYLDHTSHFLEEMKKVSK